MPTLQDDDDDEIDPEGPDPSEMDFSDDPDLEVCPHCHKLITEEAERCPHCGQYINPSDEPLSKRGWIVLIAVVLAILAILLIAI